MSTNSEKRDKKRKKFGIGFWMALGLVAALIVLNSNVVIVNSPNRRQPSRWACINNLRQLDGAKAQYMLEHSVTNIAGLKIDQLCGPENYIRHKLECPAGGAYALGGVNEDPTCSVAGHTLP